MREGFSISFMGKPLFLYIGEGDETVLPFVKNEMFLSLYRKYGLSRNSLI